MEDPARPQKDGSSFPEKPLEKDSGKGASASGSRESLLKVKKPSKFKSIFTKSKRNVPPENITTGTGAVKGILDEGTGEGDNNNEINDKEQKGAGGGSTKQLLFPPKGDKAKDSQIVAPAPVNLPSSFNVPVQIHHDPFLVRNTKKQDEPEAQIVQAPAIHEIKTRPVTAPTGPSHHHHHAAHKNERIPQRPQPKPQLRPKSRERKKSVTVMMTSTPKSSKSKSSQSKTELSQGPDSKKVVVTPRKATSGGPAPSSTPPRSSNTAIAEQPAEQHLDTRYLKRHSAKMKEKAKSKELLALVEELAHNCDYYKNALNRREDRQEAESYQLRKENESLNLQIFKLGQEIEEWREQCHKMEHRSTALSKLRSLSKENKDLLDDLEVLKSVICRLNRELSYYQDKLRTKYKDSPENLDAYSTTTSASGTEMDEGEASSPLLASKEWLNTPRKGLLPLLVSYDEVIADKEEIIKDHEVTLDRFKTRCLEVIRENEELHKLISDNKERGTISIDEWESLRVNAVLVLEENDILHNQVETLKRKEEKLFSTFQEKATAYKQTINQLDSELKKQISLVAELDSRCKQLVEENTNLNLSLQTKIPREKHEGMVQEFKQAFEELKSKYDSDKKAMMEKTTSVEKERERLVGEVSTLESENSRLRADVQDCEQNLAANNLALEKMKTTLLEQSSARDATNNVIQDFVAHVQQLVSEKNQIISDLNQQKSVNEQIMSLRAKENELVSDLHGKIEAMERLHNEEVKRFQTRLRELEASAKAQGERHHLEKRQYGELLREKEKRIECIEAEKRQLQQDLETVWKTTTTTMQNTIKGRSN